MHTGDNQVARRKHQKQHDIVNLMTIFSGASLFVCGMQSHEEKK